MKATDNQIMMAACQIASGLLSHPTVEIAELDLNQLAKISVKVAQAIASEVPEDDDKMMTDALVASVIGKYATASDGTPVGKLNSLICTGEGWSAKKAKHLIVRAESLKLIEDIGERWPVYILRKK